MFTKVISPTFNFREEHGLERYLKQQGISDIETLVSVDDGYDVPGRELGVVGDNHTKDTTYQVELPAGLHAIRWVLTGGAIGGANMIQFADAETKQPLPVHVPAAAAAQVRSMPFKIEVDVSS